MERVTLAAGCFWGVEAEFRKLEGVASTRVTEITPASTFWEAEGYHQQYLEKRGLATCRI